MNLSFAGCGFLGIYHVGVAVCFRQYAPHLLLNKISGASAGALAACALLCDLPLGELTSDILKVAIEARSRRLGPFNPNFNIQKILRDGLERTLPADAHITVNGKLHVSLTRVNDGKNVIISEFESREELINVLMMSAFIPMFSGIVPPKFKGYRYMDGGFSDNLPTLDENTITVSPFCGESDICPRDDSSQLFHINVANTSIELSRHNMYRIVRILFPPTPETLSNMCRQGFDDALRFMQRNNLINCTRCLSVQSTFVVADKRHALEEEEENFDPCCQACQVQQQEAIYSHMPDTVLSIFQEAIDSANKGLLNWMFKFKGMKLLSLLALPYMLPADVMYATITKLEVVPTVKKTPRYICDLLTNNILSVLGDSVETRSMEFNLNRELEFTNRQLVPYKNCPHVETNSQSRLLSAAPAVTANLWEASQYVINQVYRIYDALHPNSNRSNQIHCHLSVSKYGNACPDESAKNVANLNFSVDMNNSSTLDHLTANKVLSRRSSFANRRIAEYEHVDDTFEHILNITSQHEAIMAFYYTDENNKVKVTEIFDVTDDDSPVVQMPFERDANKQLEFDDDFSTSSFTNMNLLERRPSLDELSEYSVEIMDAIFSDPESEWVGSMKVEEPEDDQIYTE